MHARKGKHITKQGGKFFPTLCRTLGNLALALVILGALPLTLPRLFGFTPYSVVSASMEPALPTGSLVYVRAADPMEVLPGQIIAFRDGGQVVTHRVVENRREEGTFVTRGDANESNDLFPVSYRNLVGAVRFQVPVLGTLMLVAMSAAGKRALIFTVLAAAALSLLGGALLRRNGGEGAQS